MKKIITLVLSFLLIPQFAIASHADEFKHLIDEHRYFVTVEWDQVTKKDLVRAENKFLHELDTLLENGLTDQEIANELEIPESSFQELKTISDAESFHEFILRHENRLKGASWNGEVTAVLLFLGTVGGLLTLFTVYAVQKNRKFNACVADHGGNEDPCIER